jgi:hypothetical protein
MITRTLLVAVMLTACDSNPATPQPTPPLTTDAAVPPLASPTRTVGYRNPFGNVLQPGNLMVDGDFELTGRTDQGPWIAFNEMQGAQDTLNYDTGGRCRSGVRCGLLSKGDDFIGYLSSPLLGNFNVRVYIMPEGTNCADATVVTFDIATNDTGSAVPAMTPAPAADGWCVFQGMAQNLAYEQPALLVLLASNAMGTTLHVDEATVLPMNVVPINGITAMTRASDDVIARANVISSWIRAHRNFGRTAPHSAP